MSITYRIHRINIILVHASKGFDTFHGILARNKLIETFDFTISNFLAFCTQIGNTSVDLNRTLTGRRQKELRYNRNIYHTSTQFD
jgi:hypothetical protein